MNSHSIAGFLLFDYLHAIPEYFGKLLKLFQDGKIKILLDYGQNTPTGPFEGIHSAVNAVEVCLLCFIVDHIDLLINIFFSTCIQEKVLAKLLLRFNDTL